MNPNPNAIRILCYGDSNTWGRSGANTTRYPINVRWTGLLQQQLGDAFEVIEEGLRSRTTNLDDDDPQFPGRNGLTYLRPCLESHNPIGILVLWLGTNDLKTKFNREVEDITQALKELINEIQEVAHTSDNKKTEILLVAPPLVKEKVLKPGSQFEGAGKKSEELGEHIKQLAAEAGCVFVDLSSIEPGDHDGVHLEPEAHKEVVGILLGFID